MTSLLDDARRMVPRWRPAVQTIANGEFVTLHHRGPTVVPPDPNEALRPLIFDWKRNREFGYAADLVSAGTVFRLTNLPEEVIDAASFIISSTDSQERRAVRRIASRLLGVDASSDEALADDVAASTIAQLRDHRAATRRYPFNPLAWVDLARDHVSLGHRRAAEQSMRVALGLAPDNRFVLRSFTRLALHLGNTEKLDAPFEAWERLKRSMRTRHDPWLVAAEIATAMVIGKSPKSVKDARSLLSSRDFSPFEVSELAGALGSLEIDAGAFRRGRKLLNQALLEPTDNAVAQVAWTARNRDVTLLDSRHLALDLTFEARAWEHYRAHEWTAAIDEAERWHLDEPFAGRPLQLATFVCAVPLADFARSVELAKRGLALNPDDQVIRNNLAFALASDGQWREAACVLDKLKLGDVRKEVLIEYVATLGLIQFRRGLVEEGRAWYNRAIDRAHKERAAEQETLATLYLAREERLAGAEHANETMRRATELVKKKPLPHLKAVLSQVEATSKVAPVEGVAGPSATGPATP